MLLGSFTSFFAATIGLAQNDFKKVIAYSTCSQLGYMVLIIGLSFYSLSLFHLFNHAFFKALLFLSAGSIIHIISDEQDFRKAGYLIKSSPISYLSIIVGSLALMGVPFITGFYSKDVILEIAYINPLMINIYLLSLFAALFTSAYSTKLVYWGFFTEYNSPSIIEKIKIESDSYLINSLKVLSIFSIFIGFIFSNIFMLESLPIISSFYKNLPLIFSILSLVLVIFFVSIFTNSRFHFQFTGEAWFINESLNDLITKNIYLIGKFLFTQMDKQLIELIGPKFAYYNLLGLTQRINIFQTGIIYNFVIIFMVIMIILFIN